MEAVARYFSFGPECLARNRKYSATATTMNAPYGRAKVMIDPPKYIAVSSASAMVCHSSSSAHVEQQPEYERDDGQVVPHDGETAQRRLEPLYLLRLRIGGRLFHEGDSRDAPAAGDQDLQPDHHRQPGDERHRVEADEDAREPRRARLERQVEQLDELQRHCRESEDQRDDSG